MAIKKSATGQVITDKGADGRSGDDLKKAQAQALWEGMPRETFATVGESLGIAATTIRGWASAGKWAKIPSGKLAQEAQVAADAYTRQLSSLGPEITTEERDAAASEAGEMTAIQIRAAVLDRHRAEWSAPRKISYEAIKDRNFEKAKLAKITAETLMLIQTGERKAYGMDTKETPKDDGSVIVIDRG